MALRKVLVTDGVLSPVVTSVMAFTPISTITATSPHASANPDPAPAIMPAIPSYHPAQPHGAR